MSRLSNFALTIEPVGDIVCAYAAGQRDLVAHAYDVPDSWIVVGGFRVPEDVRARLELQGRVSNATRVVLRLKLLGNGRTVDHSLVIANNALEQTFVSEPIDLQKGVLYQIAADCKCLAPWTPSSYNSGTIRTISLGAA